MSAKCAEFLLLFEANHPQVLRFACEVGENMDSVSKGGLTMNSMPWSTEVDFALVPCRGMACMSDAQVLHLCKDFASKFLPF